MFFTIENTVLSYPVHSVYKLMYFNQRGEKCGQIIYIGIGGWDRLKEAQTVDTETRLTVKENSPESAG